jgi:hypothetical protein
MTSRENETNQIQVNKDEISLKDLILKIREICGYILSKWVIILIIGVLGASAGFLYSLSKTSEYEATLSFSVVEKSSSGGGLSTLAGQFGLNVGSSTEGVFSGNNMIELLQSRNLIERTLLSEIEVNGKRCRLIDYYIELNSPKEESKVRATISFPLGLEREHFTRAQDSLLYALNKAIITKKLSIDRQKRDANIITISFFNKDELFAKLFTEKLISIVSEFYIQTKTKDIKVNLDMMKVRADSIGKEYKQALVVQAEFVDQNKNLSKRSEMIEQQNVQIKIQLMGTTYAELLKNIETLKLELVLQTPLIQVIDVPIMPLEIKRFDKIREIMFGGFWGGFLIVVWLLVVYFYKRIMQ